MGQGDILGFIKNRPGNIAINGDFSIDQRFGGTLNSSASTYSMDRMFFSQGDSCQRVAVVGESFEHAAQIITTGGGNNMLQRIESSEVKRLRGKKATFSILIKLISGSWSGTVPQLRKSHADAKDDFSSTTLVSDDDLTPQDGGADKPTAAFRKFKQTFTITNEMADNGFFLQWGDFAGQTATIQYAQLMINESENPAPFERAGVDFPGEVIRCQRYYEKSYDLDVAPGTVTAAGSFDQRKANDANSELWTIQFAVRKRAVPIGNTYSTVTGAIEFVRNISNAVEVASGVTSLGESSMSPVATMAANLHVGFQWTADSEL